MNMSDEQLPEPSNEACHLYDLKLLISIEFLHLLSLDESIRHSRIVRLSLLFYFVNFF